MFSDCCGKLNSPTTVIVNEKTTSCQVIGIRVFHTVQKALHYFEKNFDSSVPCTINVLPSQTPQPPFNVNRPNVTIQAFSDGVVFQRGIRIECDHMKGDGQITLSNFTVNNIAISGASGDDLFIQLRDIVGHDLQIDNTTANIVLDNNHFTTMFASKVANVINLTKNSVETAVFSNTTVASGNDILKNIKADRSSLNLEGEATYDTFGAAVDTLYINVSDSAVTATRKPISVQSQSSSSLLLKSTRAQIKGSYNYIIAEDVSMGAMMDSDTLVMIQTNATFEGPSEIRYLNALQSQLNGGALSIQEMYANETRMAEMPLKVEKLTASKSDFNDNTVIGQSDQQSGCTLYDCSSDGKNQLGSFQQIYLNACVLNSDLVISDDVSELVMNQCIFNGPVNAQARQQNWSGNRFFQPNTQMYGDTLYSNGANTLNGGAVVTFPNYFVIPQETTIY